MVGKCEQLFQASPLSFFLLVAFLVPLGKPTERYISLAHFILLDELAGRRVPDIRSYTPFLAALISPGEGGGGGLFSPRAHAVPLFLRCTLQKKSRGASSLL